MRACVCVGVLAIIDMRAHASSHAAPRRLYCQYSVEPAADSAPTLGDQDLAIFLCIGVVQHYNSFNCASV